MPVAQDADVDIGHLVAAAAAASDGIYQRHQHDRGAELMPSPGPRAGELAGMLDYVRAHRLGDRLSAGHDARAALTILRYLREWANGMELAMLILGRDSGLAWHELAEAAGWHSKQAAAQRVGYLKLRAERLQSGEPGGPGERHGRRLRMSLGPVPVQPVSGSIRTAEAEDIYQRHQHDRGAELMPSPGPRAGELAGMLDYVRAHRLGDRLSAGHDARAALTILRYLREWANGMELAMLILGRDSGLAWHELAEAAGWHSKQAAAQRVGYLKLRAERLQSGEPGGTGRQAAASSDAPFLVREAGQVRAVCEAIAGTVLPDARAQESAEELALELAKAAPSPRWLMIWLVIVLDELKTAGGLGAVPPAVRGETARLVGEWEQLGAAGQSR